MQKSKCLTSSRRLLCERVKALFGIYTVIEIDGNRCVGGASQSKINSLKYILLHVKTSKRYDRTAPAFDWTMFPLTSYVLRQTNDFQHLAISIFVKLLNSF